MNAAASLDALAPVLGELGDWKRIRRAGLAGSLAADAFARAWTRLGAGDEPEAVALSLTAHAVAACRLGPVDDAVLERCGLDAPRRRAVLERGFDDVAAPLDRTLAARLRAALAPDGRFEVVAPQPAFVAALVAQPRAGATSPGKPRLMLEPPESHADHCATVAAYAVLVAPRYGASEADAFLLAMAHHLHNAVLPDAGYTGEMLLDDELEPVVERLTAQALATLPVALAHRIAALRPALASDALPAARAFHAADVIDRVLQMRHYARAAAFEISQALDDLDLVHAGPVRRFHLDVLAEARLP